MSDAVSTPFEPGGFVGDIYFGHPSKSTTGTHRWTGSEWVALPSEVEVLAGLLADARAERDRLREALRDGRRLLAIAQDDRVRLLIQLEQCEKRHE